MHSSLEDESFLGSSWRMTTQYLPKTWAEINTARSGGQATAALA
jgi:hypothetical protein